MKKTVMMTTDRKKTGMKKSVMKKSVMKTTGKKSDCRNGKNLLNSWNRNVKTAKKNSWALNRIYTKNRKTICKTVSCSIYMKKRRNNSCFLTATMNRTIYSCTGWRAYRIYKKMRNCHCCRNLNGWDRRNKKANYLFFSPWWIFRTTMTGKTWTG